MIMHKEHDMYSNHVLATILNHHFQRTNHSLRSIGSLDVPLGPAPSSGFSVVMGTKHLLIFARMWLPPEPGAGSREKESGEQGLL
jgi:hypothetical protein